MNWCILIPLLIGLISALLGYLLGRLSSGGGTDNSADIELWRNKNAQLEADLKTCRSKLSAGSGNVAASSFAATSTVAPMAFNAGAAKGVFGKTIKQDDLTLVEGIGPKIQELFHNHGVRTWKALSETNVDRCQQILDTGGERYTVHNPSTWPRQAKMAYDGNWRELLDWQDILDHGKE